jgi:hypothetical protein
MLNMGCSASCTASVPEKNFGKVTMLNGDRSVVSSGTIVPIGQRTQMFGRISMTPELKIRCDEDNKIYDQAEWIAKCAGLVKHESVYVSDPAAAKGYIENVQKAINAATTPRTPQTPRPRQMPAPPVRRTVFGIPQPLPSSTPLNMAPPPFKFDLPPLPPMVTPPRLI